MFNQDCVFEKKGFEREREMTQILKNSSLQRLFLKKPVDHVHLKARVWTLDQKTRIFVVSCTEKREDKIRLVKREITCHRDPRHET